MPSEFDKELGRFVREQFTKFHPVDDLPPALYHYTTAAGMRGIVQSSTMWAGNAEEMNDFAELRYAASVMRAHVDRQYAREHHPGACDFFRALKQQMARFEIGAHVFILSFSRDGDEPGMWGLYADRGTGFSLCMRTIDVMNLNGRQGYLMRCNYEQDALDEFCRSALSVARDALVADASAGRNPDPDACAARFVHDMAWFAPIFKLKAWEDEKEWRLVIVPPPALHRQRPDGRLYIEMTAAGAGRLPITGVCLGPDCDYEDAVLPMQQLMQDLGYHLPIHQATSFTPRPGRRAPPLASSSAAAG